MGPFWMSCGRSGRLRWADRNQTERGYISCLRLWRHSWLPVHHRYRGDAVPEPYPSKHCFHHFPLYSGGCSPVGHYASVRTCIHNQRMPDGRGILLPCKAKKRRQSFVYRKIFQRGRPAKDPLRIRGCRMGEGFCCPARRKNADNILCIARFFNAAGRQKTRSDGVEWL